MTGLTLLEQSATGRACTLARLRFAFTADDTDEELHVAIAGSDDLRDWWRNLSLHLVEWPGRHPGLVHLGFWEAAEVLHRFLWRRSRKKTVHLYGHSLGGAIAILIGLALAESGRTVEAVTTYGAPKVGDCDFAAAYPIPVTAYRCGVDPVPLVPLFGRKLVNGEERGPWFRYRALGNAIQLPSPSSWFTPFSDHSLSSYLAAMKGHAV